MQKFPFFIASSSSSSRYVAICKPFLSHTLSKLSRACKFILVSNDAINYSSSYVMIYFYMMFSFLQGIWALSIALAIPQVTTQLNFNLVFAININSIFQTLFTLHIDKDFHMCIPRTETQHYFAISTFLIFVIPMSVITVLYILIGLQLRKSKIVQRGNINGSSVRLKVSNSISSHQN